MPVVWFNRKSDVNSSVSLANYTVTLDERKCDISAKALTFNSMSDMGVETFQINMSPVQSEFWQGKSRLDKIGLVLNVGSLLTSHKGTVR